MANFQFTVDTTPMAEQVHEVTHHVSGVTVAVTAMQSAVIAAEQASAENICQNVDRGFYFLIKSQISQKSAKLHSEVNSKLMMLNQLDKALQGVKRQMEGDYSMISSRYTKLFKTLDTALRTRVFELDRTASRLSTSQSSDIAARLRDCGSAMLILQKESVSISQLGVTSRFKRNALKGIEGVAHQLSEELFLTNQLKHVVSDQRAANRQVYGIPVVVSEFDSLVTDGQFVSVTVPDLPSSLESLRGRLEATTKDIARDGSWQDCHQRDREDIRNSFAVLLESGKIDERVKNEMLRLFNTNQWQESTGARS